MSIIYFGIINNLVGLIFLQIYTIILCGRGESMDIAERLKTVRKSKKISVYRLSQLSDVSETQIRNIERGDSNPSFDTLSKLAEPLGLSLADLLNETEDVSYLNNEEKELVECFRMMSKEKSDALLNFLKTLVES